LLFLLLLLTWAAHATDSLQEQCWRCTWWQYRATTFALHQLTLHVTTSGAAVFVASMSAMPLMAIATI